MERKKSSETIFEDFTREHAIRASSDRSFGVVFAAFFALVGLLPMRHGSAPRLWALILSGVFLLAALIAPALLRPLNRVWFRIGLILHRITNPIVVGVIFLLVITPAALVARLLRRDALRLRANPSGESYWIPRDPPGPSPETLEHQF